MTPQSKAELSVVLVTPDRYDRLKKTIAHLRRQSMKERIELVIGAPSLAGLEPNHHELSEFAAAHLVEIGPIRSTGEAPALASASATAPVIAFGEDHCCLKRRGRNLLFRRTRVTGRASARRC